MLRLFITEITAFYTPWERLQVFDRNLQLHTFKTRPPIKLQIMVLSVTVLSFGSRIFPGYIN